MAILSCFQNIYQKIKINIKGGETLDNSKQGNSNPSRIPLNKGLADLQEFYPKVEKKQYLVASLHIKEKEGAQQKPQQTMAEPEHNKHQEESSGENEVENQGEFAAHFEEEEDPFRIFPGDKWYGSVERNNFFSELHNKLNRLQDCLPYLKAMERDPRYAKKCNGPSSSEVEAIIQQYVPIKEEDPGSLYLDINFANGHTDRGLIDLGSSCNIMPLSIYQKIGSPKLNPSKAYVRMTDRTQSIAMGELDDYLVRLGELFVPVDFVVLDMDQDDEEEPYLQLGR